MADTEKGEKSRGRGRPPKLTAHHKSTLRELALANPHISLEALTVLFVETSGVKVAASTVRSALKALGVDRVRIKRAKAGSAKRLGEDSSVRYGYTQAHRDEGDDERDPSGLTDSEWEVVEDLFETHGPGRRPRHSRRSVVDACIYVVRSGCPWRMLPKDMPPWQTVYAHFRRWAGLGVFERMHDRLRAMWRAREHRDAAPTAAVIDSQSTKTSEQGGPKGFDAGKKVKGRKRHLPTDTLGLLLAVFVHTADIQDRDGAGPLIEQGLEKYPTIEKVFADSAYAGSCARDIKRQHGVDVEIARRPTKRWHDRQLPLFEEPAFVPLPKRWMVERTNAWNNRPRRLVKDQDRRMDVSEAWIWFTEARLLLRRLVWPTVDAAA